jgi:hypothetical protein
MMDDSSWLLNSLSQRRYTQFSKKEPRLILLLSSIDRWKSSVVTERPACAVV